MPAVLPDGSVACGCSANMRWYQYAAGQRFGKHIDESNEDETGAHSEYTLLLYLNGGNTDVQDAENGALSLTGGETVFYKGSYGNGIAAKVAPLEGLCIIHGHGSRCFTHEGAPVISGLKYVLRTDVMYRR